jgi:hypothetical protein
VNFRHGWLPGFSFILYIQYSGLAITHGTGVCCWLAMGWVGLGLDRALFARLLGQAESAVFAIEEVAHGLAPGLAGFPRGLAFVGVHAAFGCWVG